mmetsp:Transcript_47164/g.151361  ORF Transcript_47164/g.151361 Transcript_47164/m.151361 type:complete len:104 (+) Transcript_47164:184-495(+)
MFLIVICVSINQWWAAKADAEGDTTAFQIAALLLTAQIKVFDFIWSMVATYLTDMDLSKSDYTCTSVRSLRSSFSADGGGIGITHDKAPVIKQGGLNSIGFRV